VAAKTSAAVRPMCSPAYDHPPRRIASRRSFNNDE
jgi:hypothetical protein